MSSAVIMLKQGFFEKVQHVFLYSTSSIMHQRLSHQEYGTLWFQLEDMFKLVVTPQAN